MTEDPLLFDVREAAQGVRACAVFDDALLLATWLGTGRLVTPKGVPRPGDVAELARVLGATVPPRFRSAADLPWLHEPWTTALEAGFVVVDGAVAHAGEALAEWVGAPDEVVLDRWWRVFRARIEEWDDPDDPWSGIPTVPVAALRLLAAEPGRLPAEEFTTLVEDLSRWGSGQVVFRSFRELPGSRDQRTNMIVKLLTRFGTVASANGKVELAPLGRWASDQVTKLTPPTITETMAAPAVLAAVAGVEEGRAWRRVFPWLRARTSVAAARELLTAASSASPTHRMAALSLVSGLDDSALPAWREAAELPQVGPAARMFLAQELGEPEPTGEEVRWQLVDECVALLDEEGVAGLQDIWDNLPGGDADTKIISVEGAGHPDAGRLIDELRRYEPLNTGRPAPAVYQLKISLMRMRPPVWRRVEVPGDIPLGGLHVVIQAAMGWDGDHLHQFTVDRRHFSDPAYELEVADEWAVDLVGVLPRQGLIASYLYDFGDSWQHTVEVEKIHDAEADVTYPRCVEGKGTRPGEDGGEPEPFDIERINFRLDKL